METQCTTSCAEPARTGGLWGRIQSFLEARRSRRRRREALCHLDGLEDWQLDDIGISRADIERMRANEKGRPRWSGLR